MLRQGGESGVASLGPHAMQRCCNYSHALSLLTAGINAGQDFPGVFTCQVHSGHMTFLRLISSIKFYQSMH